MNKLSVVAFCGSKGAGKSTSSEIFKSMVDVPTEELALADHLKNVCSEIFEIAPQNFFDQNLKEKELLDYVVLESNHITAVIQNFEFSEEQFTFDEHIRPHVGKVLETPRKLLQYIGTEVLHKLDPLVHVKIMLSKRSEDKLTLITDLRFPQEFDALMDLCGESFKPAYVQNNAAEAAAESDGHASERGYHLFKHRCHLVDNNSNLANLHKNVKAYAEKIMS